MSGAAIIVLLGLLLIATATDVARHRIYNWTTYPGILAGCAINTFTHGWTGLQESVFGFLACGLIMLLCFVLFNMGGGDVKLIAMMGAFLGLEKGFEALLWTFVLGGIMGTIMLIWQIGILRMISKTAHHLWLVAKARSWIPLTQAERAPLRRWLFLAPAGLIAVCIVAGERIASSG